MPHIHELYDFTVSFMIVYDHRVLLVNHPRYHKWINPGGHVELNEDPEQALYREIEEETGLQVTILNQTPQVPGAVGRFLPTPGYLMVHDANPPHKHIDLMYFAVAKNGQAVLSDEHQELAWVGRDELEDERYHLEPEIKFFVKQALDLAAEQQ